MAVPPPVFLILPMPSQFAGHKTSLIVTIAFDKLRRRQSEIIVFNDRRDAQSDGNVMTSTLNKNIASTFICVLP